MNAGFPNFNLNMSLSMEQEFRMRLFKESVESMKPDEMKSLLMEASKLLMVKDNIIKGLMKSDPVV